jgi:hypothetical protein
MIRLEGETLPPEARGAIPPILFGDLLRDVPGIPVQVGWAATLADNCGIDASVLSLRLGGADLAELLAGVPASGVVQLDNEWLAYSAILTGPVRLAIAERGYRETEPAAHAKGATVYFVETRPLYVFAYVPPGCHYGADTLVQLRVNDNAETPPCTIRLGDERLVDGERFITAEFDASRAFYAQGEVRLPSHAVIAPSLLAGAPDALGAPDARPQVLRTRSTSGLRHVVALSAMRGAAGAAGAGGAYASSVHGRDVGTLHNNRVVSNRATLPPPPARMTAMAPSPVFAGNGGQRVVSLRQGTLGRVTADLRGLCDTQEGRYSGVPLGRLVQPAAIVRCILEDTYGERNPSAYHEPTWTRTAARHAALRITWRLVWAGDTFESFRDAAQSSGQADLYLDDDGRWRYGFRDPLTPAVGTLTPRELLGDPALGWTAGREIITALEVAWGAGVQGGTFTLDSPVMRDRHGPNHGGAAIPYAASETIARVLGRAILSQRDRPRQACTLAASHAWLGLTLADRVFLDTALGQLYGAKRVPFEIVGITDRGDERTLTMLEADPLAVELFLSGTLLRGTPTLPLPLTGTLDAELAAAIAALSGTLIRTLAASRPLSGILIRPATPLARPLTGTLAAVIGGVVIAPLTGTLIRLVTTSRPLSGALYSAGLTSRPLAGTLVRAITTSRPLAGTLVRTLAPSVPLSGSLDVPITNGQWDAAGATWDRAGAKWDDVPVTPPTLGHVTTVGDTGTTTDTVQSFTTAADENYLLVCVGIRGVSMSSIGGVSFGATALTALKDQLDTNGSLRATLYGGTVPPGTTANVTVDYVGGNANAVIAIRAYKGVGSVGTAVAAFTAAGTSLSVTLAGVTNARCVDFIVTHAGDANPTLGAGQATEFTRFHDGASQVEMDGSFIGAATTMQWTGLNHGNDDAVMIAVPLLG